MRSADTSSITLRIDYQIINTCAQGLRSKIKTFSKELPTPSYQPGQGSPPPHASALKHPENSPPGTLTKQKSKSVSFLDNPHLPKLAGSPFQEWSSSIVSSFEPSIENICVAVVFLVLVPKHCVHNLLSRSSLNIRSVCFTIMGKIIYLLVVMIFSHVDCMANS